MQSQEALAYFRIDGVAFFEPVRLPQFLEPKVDDFADPSGRIFRFCMNVGNAPSLRQAGHAQGFFQCRCIGWVLEGLPWNESTD